MRVEKEGREGVRVEKNRAEKGASRENREGVRVEKERVEKEC